MRAHHRNAPRPERGLWGGTSHVVVCPHFCVDVVVAVVSPRAPLGCSGVQPTRVLKPLVFASRRRCQPVTTLDPLPRWDPLSLCVRAVALANIGPLLCRVVVAAASTCSVLMLRPSTPHHTPRRAHVGVRLAMGESAFTLGGRSCRCCQGGRAQPSDAAMRSRRHQNGAQPTRLCLYCMHERCPDRFLRRSPNNPPNHRRVAPCTVKERRRLRAGRPARQCMQKLLPPPQASQCAATPSKRSVFETRMLP